MNWVDLGGLVWNDPRRHEVISVFGFVNLFPQTRTEVFVLKY